jgi:hypothetical protein
MPTLRTRGVDAPTPDATVSALGVRVDDLAENIRGLWQSTRDIESRMASGASVALLSTKIDGLFTQQAEQNKAPWPTLISAAGFILVLAGGYSTLQTAPIKADIERLEKGTQTLSRDSSAEFKEIRNMIVPRGEHEQRWANAAANTANIQRQLDDNAKAFGNTYSLRDALSDLNRRLDKMEMGSGAARMSSPPPGH